MGADGALWFTEFVPARIGRIAADGQLTEFALRAGSGPVGITAARDGGIWFADYNSARIGHMDLSGTVTAEYNVPTPDSRPIQIAVEPGRGTTLWFTEQAVNQIGRLQLGPPAEHHMDPVWPAP